MLRQLGECRSFGREELLTVPEQTSVPKLATMWEFGEIRNLAILKMTRLTDTVDKVLAARDYRIGEQNLQKIIFLASVKRSRTSALSSAFSPTPDGRRPGSSWRARQVPATMASVRSRPHGCCSESFQEKIGGDLVDEKYACRQNRC
jgi:hypothetical protein